MGRVLIGRVSAADERGPPRVRTASGVLAVAVAACVRGAPHTATETPLTEPLVIGRSPDAAIGEDERDAGPLVSTWMLTKPEPPRAPMAGCHIKSIGSNGGITTEVPCVVEQEFEPHSLKSSQPFVGIWSVSVANGAKISVGIFRRAPPVVGAMPMAAYDAIARVEKGSDLWQAETHAYPTTQNSQFRFATTSVRTLHVDGGTAYEIHGTLDVVQVIPTVQGTAVGWMDVHIDF